MTPPERGKTMPTRTDFVTMVANQMMKGPNYGRLAATGKQKQLFLKRHEDAIRWVVGQLPRCSAAVPAVLVKCLIKYGEEPVAKFCRAIKDGVFSGQDDPALHLWKFLLKHQGKDTVLAYEKTACAAKAFMEGKRLEALRSAKSDIFDWDEDWTVPDDLLPNWNPQPGSQEVVVPGVVD